jgi:LysR family glycine cleavage system transcriptional activator
LRISVAPSFATRWLVPRLPAFLDRHPNIRLEVTASRAVEDLAGDGFDMAIRFGPGAYEGLHAELLAKADVRPVCAPSLARRLRSPADLDPRLLMHDAYPFGASGVPGWREWLAAAGLGKATSTGMHFDTTHLLLEAALEGQGVALGLNLLIEDDLRTGRLVCPFGPVLPVEKWAFHFVCTRASLSRPSVRSVRNWLRTELGHSSAAEPDLTE